MVVEQACAVEVDDFGKEDPMIGVYGTAGKFV